MFKNASATITLQSTATYYPFLLPNSMFRRNCLQNTLSQFELNLIVSTCIYLQHNVEISKMCNKSSSCHLDSLKIMRWLMETLVLMKTIL